MNRSTPQVMSHGSIETWDQRHWSTPEKELVAELGAFLICNKLQICSDELNHAAYLKHWIEVLQQRPDALRLALSDASKAAGLICKDLDQQVEVNM